jgi:uncharacterized protein YciI
MSVNRTDDQEDDSARYFVAVRSYGKAFDKSVSFEFQPEWEAHRAFMNALEADGTVCLGGPLENTDKVLLIIRAGNADEVRRRLDQDPWTRAGLLETATIDPWNLRIGRIG